jgi:hypothetical protein
VRIELSLVGTQYFDMSVELGTLVPMKIQLMYPPNHSQMEIKELI